MKKLRAPNLKLPLPKGGRAARPLGGRAFRLIIELISLIAVLALALGCADKDAVRPPFNAEDSFTRANALIEDKKYEDARKELNEIKSHDFGGTYAPLASLRIADTYLMESEAELAVDELRRFLDLYPGHKFAPYAQYRIAMAYYKQVEDVERGYALAEKAMNEFEALMERYPRNPYAEEALEKIAALKVMRADYEFMVGEFYFKKGAYKGALGRFLWVLENFPDYKKEPDALFRIAVAYKELGQSGKAEEYLRLLEEKYPQSEALAEAKKGLRAPAQ